MAEKTNGNDYEFKIEDDEGLLNGKKKLPLISSALRLDSYFDENSDLNDLFVFHELERVIDLSMQANCLFNLPDNFSENLSNLIKINLSHNNLRELDVCLKTLKNLEELIVDKNRLTELPEYIGDLYNLRLISAEGNQLRNIPDNFVNLVNLEELNFSNNEIKSVPYSWKELSKLKILNLSNNELRSVPKCIVEGLPGLEIIDLSRNLITEFRDPPVSNNLKKLYLNNNCKNDQFPNWLLTEKFYNLEELILDETAFANFNIPDKRTPLLHLRKLSMTQCGLSDTDFEKVSQSMIDLEYLNIGNNFANNDANSFWVMPAQNLKNSNKLEALIIQGAGLPAVPRDVNLLEKLTRLDISRNNISSLPEEICELKRLEFFNAARNNLYALPQAIGNLTALKILFLETNRLSGLPDTIQNLKHLECLDLYNNEFLQVPKQLDGIPNLKALDIDGNVFETENLQIANMSYQRAKDILRSTSNLLLRRSNDPKVLDEADVQSLVNSSLDYEDDRCSGENKSLIDLNLSDIASEENWSISEDSADEYDPTAQPRVCLAYSPFTVSSVVYYGNFCPADLHTTAIKDQLAAMRSEQPKSSSSNIEEGQFDDA